MSAKIDSKLTIKDCQFKDKRVIIRVDFNVPFKGTSISDSFRIISAIPTIKYILSQQPKSVFLISHLGRPQGKITPSLSFAPLLPEIQKVLQTHGITHTLELLTLPLTSPSLSTPTESSSTSKFYLLENIRFFSEEESKTVTESVILFRNNLTSLGDIFVFDAFGCSHRAHSSVVGINLPKATGFLMQRECSALGQFLSSNNKACLILGGAKIKDKIKLIENMLNKIKVLIIGGAMANTFLHFEGYNLGNSFLEKSEETKNLVEKIKQEAVSKGVEIVLPIDLVNELKTVNIKEIKNNENNENCSFCDIGEKSVNLILSKVKECDKVFWNGPVGKFEDERFNKGTFKLLEKMSELDTELVIGGGDTASAAKKIGEKLGEKVYVSTGGGASLELLEGRELPGLEALTDK